MSAFNLECTKSKFVNKRNPWETSNIVVVVVQERNKIQQIHIPIFPDSCGLVACRKHKFDLSFSISLRFNLFYLSNFSKSFLQFLWLLQKTDPMVKEVKAKFAFDYSHLTFEQTPTGTSFSMLQNLLPIH